VPPPDQHDLGGYTTWPARTAALEQQAEPIIAATLTDMIKVVAPRGPSSIITQIGRYEAAVYKQSMPIGYWKFEETKGHIGSDRSQTWYPEGRAGENEGAYESGIAYHLDGRIQSDISRLCIQFAGGRMKANLKDLGPTYTAEFWVWNGFPADVRPV